MKIFQRSNVLQRNKELTDKIVNGINEKCIIPYHMAEEVEQREDEVDIFRPTLREAYECVVNVVGEVATKNGMTDEWNEYQPKFKQHLDAWKKCDTLENRLKRFL